MTRPMYNTFARSGRVLGPDAAGSARHAAAAVLHGPSLDEKLVLMADAGKKYARSRPEA
eukprot:CAMPEP_0119295896 /NCGR_PEP_ID=MMETSP1329-20130426/50295_1 /TAXON_ID=114041 /ORGANISM="Genus nov. species nov., Strain RCC1024" /LENGTH=58 /DNA_ID=CAMNT_0007296817 /DNA_START=1250 /DNA_END=1423 /DNA_ORIENTATION=-